jgi:hypothetical protein
MTRQLLSFSICLALMAGSVQAQSTLDRYLKKNSQGSAASTAQADPAIVFKDSAGHWRLDDARQTGGFCAVTYFAAPYIVGYVGPVVGNPDSFILFSGPTIPPITKEKKKKMSLTTADGMVQSVAAFHVPNPQSQDSGIILFRLTDIQAAMSDMSDMENLNVVMDKKQVFAIKWTGGLTARAAMQKCLNNSAQNGRGR